MVMPAKQVTKSAKSVVKGRKQRATPMKPERAPTRQAKRSASTAKRTDIHELAATQPLATVKTRFSEFVDRVHRYRERIVVTRNGVPVAVLIDPDELFSIEETLELMSDPEAMEALAEAESGEPMTGDEFIERMKRAFGPRPR
jgi:antitoxin YefM